MAMQPLRPRIGLWLAVAGLAGIVVAERLWPKRVRRQPELQRTLTNVALGAMSLAVVAGVQQPLARPLARRIAERRQGLAQAMGGPDWQRDLIAMLLLDWSMYHWHVATHRVPVLWRLHRVHHVDADMDASTALRFHALDMAISVPLRLAQVRLFGVSPRALAIWEGFFFASVLFHHADIDVPGDARLAWLLTTPGMHDIHHRADPAALDSNFSAGISLWDRLHGTFSDRSWPVPIGLPDGGPQGLLAALAMPFETAVTPALPGQSVANMTTDASAIKPVAAQPSPLCQRFTV
jgi:sterol desaturase/sphingolipid hydroxylase (fatty acid hydroxylase superfamily)